MKKVLLIAFGLFVLNLQMPQIVLAKSPTIMMASVTSSQSSLKSIFKNNIGMYPFDVNLLSKPAVKKRLVALLGSGKYNFMVKNFDVQTPIEFGSWNYHTSACQAHNCGTTEFELSYNPDSDALAVRYKVDGREQIFKEKRSVNAYWDY